MQAHQSARHKIDNLTGIRGFAALWVATYHFQTTPIVANLRLGSIIAQGKWGVDVFFVLSGLILAVNYAPRFSDGLTTKRYVDFIIKRFARIYPVHLVTFLAMVVAWTIAQHLGYQFHGSVTNDWFTAACNVLMIHAWGVTNELSWNSPSWSISAEWGAYLFLLPVCIVSLKRLSPATCLLVACLLWIMFMFCAVELYSGDIGQFTTAGLVRIVPEFVAGYAAYRYLTEHGSEHFGDGLTLIGLASISSICYVGGVAVWAVLPSITLLMLGLYRGGKITDAVFGNRASVFLGEISYSMYMTHLFVQIALNLAVRRLGGNANTALGIAILGTELVLTIAFGYCMYVAVEFPARVGLLRRLTRLHIEPQKPLQAQTE